MAYRIIRDGYKCRNYISGKNIVEDCEFTSKKIPHHFRICYINDDGDEVSKKIKLEDINNLSKEFMDSLVEDVEILDLNEIYFVKDTYYNNTYGYKSIVCSKTVTEDYIYNKIVCKIKLKRKN